MNPYTNAAQNHKRLAIVVASFLLLAIVSILVFAAVRKPNTEDFKVAQTVVLEVTKTQEALPTAVNSYFAAYTRELNTTGSAQKAKANAAKEYEAFVKAESKAMAAIKKLEDTKAANDTDVDQAIEQFIEVSTSRTNYYSGMANSYADFKGLFGGSKEMSCSGIFIGSSESLTARKDQIKKAAENCYQAIETLKKSKNSSYVEYAFQIERRVKQLEQDAASIAKSEQQNNEYLKQLPVYEQKAADAKARNAPEKEVLALLGEIKALNAKVKDNRADFDFSSKRYLKTLKEFPTLAEAVFSTTIPAKLKNYTSLSDVRQVTLKLVLDDKLVN